MFRAIHSDNFPPFGEFTLKLPPVEDKPADLCEVHLLTGVNGTGKTRLLAFLCAFLGNAQPLLQRLKGSAGSIQCWATDKSPLPEDRGLRHRVIKATAGAEEWRLHESSIPLGNPFIALPAFAYTGTAYVGDAEISVLANLPKPDRTSCLSFVRPPDHSKQLLQAITNLKVQSLVDSQEQRSADQRQGRAAHLLKVLETTLSEMTGAPFAFRLATHPKVSLAIRWGRDTLTFDLLPDGLRSILGWLVHAVVMLDGWLQGKVSPMDAEAVFLLDEIESHLHPAWQRKILPAFQRLLPKAQIIVATHSPFVIASLNHGWIHRIALGPDGKAAFLEPVPASRGDSYVSVVEDIMGLKEWYDPETEALLGKFRTCRDAAYRGDRPAQAEARRLAAEIGRRSMELDYMMGRELNQMDRQLARASAVK